jgi:hypothetical protein
MHAKATGIAATLAGAQQTRRQWAALTEPTRTMAQAADLELRRRYPDGKFKPLGAEPAASAGSPGDAEWISPALTHLGKRGQEPAQIFLNNKDNKDFEEERIAPGHSAVAQQAGLAALDIDPAVADRLAGMARRARRAQQHIDALAALPQFADEEQSVYAGPSWDMTARPQRDATIQPPRPQVWTWEQAARIWFDTRRNLSGRRVDATAQNGKYGRVLRCVVVRDAFRDLSVEPSAGCRAVIHLGPTGSDPVQG